MAVNDFKWVEETYQFDEDAIKKAIMKIVIKGYYLEVDIQYLNELYISIYKKWLKTMCRYSVKPRGQTFIIGYGFLPLAKKNGQKNIGKNSSKNLTLNIAKNFFIILNNLLQMH